MKYYVMLIFNIIIAETSNINSAEIFNINIAEVDKISSVWIALYGQLGGRTIRTTKIEKPNQTYTNLT